MATKTQALKALVDEPLKCDLKTFNQKHLTKKKMGLFWVIQKTSHRKEKIDHGMLMEIGRMCKTNRGMLMGRIKGRLRVGGWGRDKHGKMGMGKEGAGRRQAALAWPSPALRPTVCPAFSLKSVPACLLCHLTILLVHVCDLPANTGWTCQWEENQSVERPKAGAGGWLNRAQSLAGGLRWARGSLCVRGHMGVHLPVG